MYILLKSITSKKVFFSAIGMLVACVACAQQLYGPRSDYYMNDNFLEPSIGVEVGAGVSNIVGYSNSYFKSGSIAGFNAGVTFCLPITYPVSFAPEVLYDQRGYTAQTSNGNFTQRVSCIDVPLLAKIKVGPLLNIYAGPQFAFLVSKKNTFNTGFVAATEQYYNDSDGRATYIDAVLGVSVNLTSAIDLRVRYIIDLQQTGANGNIYVPGYSNQLWQMGLGFKF